MTAVLQIELIRDRWRVSYNDAERPTGLKLAQTALLDVFANGGTLVVVVKDDKLTIVQRDDSEDMDENAESEAT